MQVPAQAQVQAQVQVHVTAPALRRFGALRAHLAELTEAALRNTTCTRAKLQLHLGGVGLQVWRRRTTTQPHVAPSRPRTLLTLARSRLVPSCSQVAFALLFALLLWLCSLATPAAGPALAVPSSLAVPPPATTLHWFEIVLGVLLALKFPELALWMSHIVTPGHVEQDAAPVVTADVVGIPENPVA